MSNRKQNMKANKMNLARGQARKVWKRGRDLSCKGSIILYRGKKVRITERATGFVKGPERYWVRALEPVAGYAPGEEFTVSRKHVHRQLKEEK